MYERIIGGIILITFSIVLLTQPWQLFVRNGSLMFNQVKSKAIYVKSLRLLGATFLILGIVIVCSILIV